MKKFKILLILAFFLGASSSIFAQMTTGEPSSNKIRTGNRPGKGSFGLYIGASSNMFQDIFDSSISLKALPLINFKYMSSNNFEWRVGLEVYESSEKITAIEEVSVIKSNETTDRYGESAAILSPGFAYHFSRNNILDVYCGMELPLGWNSNSMLEIDSQAKSSISTKKSAFNVGLGAFIGMQAFIANLPLAIGVEYGISSRLDFGLKYKTETVNGNNTQISYSPITGEFNHLNPSYGDYYDNLKAKTGSIGNQLRVTLSYYFK